jgi:hypothetical protein
MQQVPRFETQLSELRATMKLRALLADLHRQVQLLDTDIAEEQQRTGIFDAADVAYSTLARYLSGRRDNLLATIRLLESQLAETDVAA